jgi:hypothetical protein
MCAGQQSPPPLPGFSYDANALALAGNKAIKEADIPRGYGRGGARMRAARMNEVRQAAMAAEKERQRNAYFAKQQARADQISAERTRIGKEQEKRRKEMEAQQAAAIASAQAETERLQKVQSARLKELASQTSDRKAAAAAAMAAADASRAAALESKAQAQATGGAVAASLGVLSDAGRPQGKTATISRRRGNKRGSRQTSASLRLGQTGSGSGSGSNLSI